MQKVFIAKFLQNWCALFCFGQWLPSSDLKSTVVSKKNGHTVAIQKGPLELTGLTVFNFKYCAVY